MSVWSHYSTHFVYPGLEYVVQTAHEQSRVVPTVLKSYLSQSLQ